MGRIKKLLPLREMAENFGLVMTSIRLKRPETDIKLKFDESDSEIEWIGR